MEFRQCTLRSGATTLVANLDAKRVHAGLFVKLKNDDRWWLVEDASHHVVAGELLHETGRFASLR